MPRPHAAALLLPVLLGSCSQRTELSARFLDGVVAFAASRGEDVSCVSNLAVVDTVSQEVIWEIGEVGTGSCQAALPIRYGQPTPALRQRAKPLKLGRRYTISGSASGGNSLDGRFDMRRATLLRLTDLPWDERIDEPALNATENQLQ